MFLVLLNILFYCVRTPQRTIPLLNDSGTRNGKALVSDDEGSIDRSKIVD